MLTIEEYKRITQICTKLRIKNYTINVGGVIDVCGDVDLGGKHLTEFPITFGKVSGTFSCNYNNLTSLRGGPTHVDGDYHCMRNLLTSLEHAPIYIGGYVNCSDNKITSFKGLPNKINGICCSSNRISNFEFVPQEIVDGFSCRYNPFTTFEGCPSLEKTFFDFSFTGLPQEHTQIFASLTKDEFVIFIKYQNDYEVWEPVFNEENANGLVLDIRDGLA